jgi:hypothetical protein
MKSVAKLAVMALVVAAAAARAQDSSGAEAKAGGEEKVKYSKTTTINFEDDTIEGDLSKPDGEYVEARKKVRHSNLIRIREEFKDKVMDSVGEL